MDDNLLFIPNDNKQNYPFGRLTLLVGTSSLEPTNQNAIKVPKVFEPMNKIIKLWVP